eukprot:52121-Rhodomonas_salina.1
MVIVPHASLTSRASCMSEMPTQPHFRRVDRSVCLAMSIVQHITDQSTETRPHQTHRSSCRTHSRNDHRNNPKLSVKPHTPKIFIAAHFVFASRA